MKIDRAPGNVIFALLTMLWWGTAFPMIKLSYAELQLMPGDTGAMIAFAGMRFTLASLIVLVVTLFLRKGRLNYPKDSVRFALWLGILDTGVQFVAFYMAMGYISGVKSSIIQSSSAFFIVLIAHCVFPDDRITPRRAMCLAIGFAGILVANLGGGFDWHMSFKGEGLMLLAAFIAALDSVIVKIHGQGMDPFALACVQMGIGGVLLLVVGYLLLGGPLPMTPKAWGLAIYGGVMSAGAFLMWVLLLTHNPAGQVSIYWLFIPIFGTILSAWLVPGERLTWPVLAGLVLVVLATLLLQKEKPQVREDLRP